MKTLFLGSTAILASLFFLAGCNSANTAGGSTGGTKSSQLVVGVVFDSGGIGDKSFNDSANAGVQKAATEDGISVKSVQSQSEKDYAQNLTAMADAGCKLIFAVGLNQEVALKEVAPKYPNVHFAIIDGDVDAPNVRSLKFAEQQGSFLAGYLAAKVTKTHILGFVGGENLDLIKKFAVGYTAGALTADPCVKVLAPKYVGDWDNVDIAQAEANQLFGSGADIVYHAAGRAGQGVIAAAKAQGKYAIGVDSDQDYVAPGFVLTSVIKRVDQAVFQTITDELAGKFSPGAHLYDLKQNGVGLSEMKYTKDKISPDVLKQLSTITDELKSGKIVAPSTYDELATFTKGIACQGKQVAYGS